MVHGIKINSCWTRHGLVTSATHQKRPLWVVVAEMSTHITALRVRREPLLSGSRIFIDQVLSILYILGSQQQGNSQSSGIKAGSYCVASPSPGLTPPKVNGKKSDVRPFPVPSMSAPAVRFTLASRTFEAPSPLSSDIAFPGTRYKWGKTRPRCTPVVFWLTRY